MKEFPKRKQIRLKEYDYSQAGYYFITICTKNREPLFWDSVGADTIRPQLTPYGTIADRAINAIPLHYQTIEVDCYTIMPDHIHLILRLTDGRQVAAPTVMRVIGQMKRWISKEIGVSIWQKSYYEHIIRDEKDYHIRVQYLLNNPYNIIQKPCRGRAYLPGKTIGESHAI